MEHYFFELHKGLPRQAPGDALSTTRALSLLPEMSKHPQVLDIGCGPGAQTLVLAQLLPDADLIALDNYEPFLEELKQRAADVALQERIVTVPASMDNMPFASESFDLIWAEGSIYNIGLNKGLTLWKKYLKPGGYLVFSELCWLKVNPPDEVLLFWQEGYPGMMAIDQVKDCVLKNGYQLLDHFVIPENAWWKDYYRPLEKNITDFKIKYEGNQTAMDIAALEEKEISMYHHYHEYYGYVFFCLKNQ